MQNVYLFPLIPIMKLKKLRQVSEICIAENCIQNFLEGLCLFGLEHLKGENLQSMYLFLKKSEDFYENCL